MFRERIKQAYADMSPSFQKLGNFIMDHPYDAAFMTATQLGRRLAIDTATVVRFAQRLDYPGFPELLDEVQDEVREQLNRYFQPPPGADSEPDVFRAALRQDMTNIGKFDLTMQPATVERVVSMLDAAEQIIVLGEGMFSRPLADMLANALAFLGRPATTLSLDAVSVATAFRSLTPKHLVIAIAASQYCPDATSAMEVARAFGAQTMAFVGAQSWPIARAVDLSVLCPNAGATEVSSCSIFAVAISSLYQALFAARHLDTTQRFVEFEKVVRGLTEARSRFEFVPPMSAAKTGSDNGQPE
jgi:DNA-binding MurR/RpiR family transcriptional regulator